MLRISNLYKSFDKNIVLDNITVKLSDRFNIVGLVGPNGAGKTTFLNCITGVLNSKHDEILIENISLKHNAKLYKQNISFIPDNDNISYYLTGREFLVLSAKMRDLKKSVYLNKINQLSEYFDIDKDLDRLLEEYSHGMIKKISLIAGFLDKKKLYILDEPFNGLDPEMIILIKKLILELSKKGSKFIISSHYLEGLENFTDYTLLLDKGKFRFKGDIKDFVKKYSMVNKSLSEAWLNYLGILDKKEEDVQNIVNNY